MQTILLLASWLLDFLRYCLHHLRPKLSWKLLLLLAAFLVLSLCRARRHTSLSFTAEKPTEPRPSKSVPVSKRTNSEAVSPQISVEYIQRFVEAVSKSVGERLSSEYQSHVSARRALLRTDFRLYQLCVCDWVRRIETEIDSRAKVIAQQDAVDWGKLEPMLGKYMRFSRFKLSIPALQLQAAATARKPSVRSCEEIVEFADRLRKKGFPIEAEEGVSKQLRAKIAETAVEDEVWTTFNVELRQAVEFARSRGEGL